ncbi:unnamed protein product [Symbiodinium sp. KB8]|nr:unnamed protein product [Symbiodinium sp. KB8]
MTRVFSFVDADEVTQELFRFAKDNLWLMSILQIILYWLEMQSMRRVSHLQRLRPYFIVTMSVYAVIEALKTVAEVWVKEGPMELIMTLLALLVYAAVVVTAAVNGIKLLLKLREIKRKGGKMDKALRQLTLAMSAEAPHIAIPGPPAKAPANEDSETKLLISPEDDLGDIPEEAEHDDNEEEGVEESEHDQLVLPDGWIEDIEDGQVYYLYAATGDWQWTHPALGVEVEIEE